MGKFTKYMTSEGMINPEMQQNQEYSMQNFNPSTYQPPMDMQNDYQLPLDSFVNGAANEGSLFAQQATMAGEARDFENNKVGDFLNTLGSIFRNQGGNPIYNEPYGNSFDMQFPLSNDMKQVYGSYRRPTNLGSFTQY